MPRAKKDDAIVAYVKAHPKLADRSADTMAHRLGMSEVDLRALVHESGRVYMRAILLGWHAVELAPQERDNGDIVADDSARDVGGDAGADTGVPPADSDLRNSGA